MKLLGVKSKTDKLTEFPNFVATATKLSKQKKRIWR